MNRKRKLKLIQITLLTLGMLIIFYTYYNKQKFSGEKIISLNAQKKIQKQIVGDDPQSDVFYNIEYSGLDLAGNRYILKSQEATNSKDKKNIVNMKIVEAIFYFKDNTLLNVLADSGTYNNKSLDMIFKKNVRAVYQGSRLFAEKAEYSNSKSFLTITENVKVVDSRGTMVADKLLFDIKKERVHIESFDDKRINANINLK
jgi:lipopolysaccharide assembly outer membrane protein LptD (OstA)